MNGESFEEWLRDEAVARAIDEPGAKLMLIIGASDTGKTTLAEAIVRRLCAQRPVGIVDLDIGQSHIGPPTTIAWGRATGGFSGWEGITVEGFYFTGTVSPVDNLASVLTGACLVTGWACSSCDRVIVDTTGLVHGPAGTVLKQHKIDLLRPDLVLALERKGDLSTILDPFFRQEKPRVIRMQVPELISEKSASYRAQFRSSALMSYFDKSRLLSISPREVGFRYTAPAAAGDRAAGGYFGVPGSLFGGKQGGLTIGEMRKRIVSLRDAANRDRALGLIEELDEGGKRIIVRTPLGREIGITTVVIGTVKLEP